MKVRIPGKELQDGLKNVAPAANTEFGMKLEAKDNPLLITAFRRDLTIQVSIPAKVDEPGQVVVYHSAVISRVNSLIGGEVRMETKDDKLSILGGKARFGIGCLPTETFPKVSIPPGEAATIDMRSLADAVNQVLPSASVDPGRPVLTGILLDPADKDTTLVATDSYRLAVRKLDLTGLLADANVVPASAFRALLKLVSSGTIQVRANDNAIAFSSSDKLLVASLLGSQYPNYSGLLPTKFATSWTVNRQELLSCLGRATIALEGGSAALHITVDDKGAAVASLANGEFAEDLTGTLTGNAVSFAVNPAYFADGVRVCQGEEVSLGANDPMKPLGLSSSADPNFRYIVMPVRK